jgi:hypothetical protein
MRLLAVLLMLCAWPAQARAQQPAPERVSPVLLPTIHFGAPLRAAGGLAVFQRLGDSRSGVLGAGLVVEGSAGLGGARGSVGYLTFEDAIALDARVVVTRTWGSPLAAATGATYVGAEAGLSIAYVRVSAGVGQRVAGPAGPRRTIVTWSAGLQFPLRRD